MNLQFSFQESAVVFEAKELLGEKKNIHERALIRVQRYLVAEADLLESIIEADQNRLFEDFGLAYLTPYCVKYLGLSEDVAANFVRVARKTYEVPELKAAIDEGKLSVTKAKAIVSVINTQNQKNWIEKAENFSKSQLEKAVATESPKPKKPEKAKFEAPNRVRYEFDLTEEESVLFKRAQDLLCQKKGQSVSLSETQAELLRCFLDKHDPVRKAQRNIHKSQDPSRERSEKKKMSNSKRSSIKKTSDSKRASMTKSSNLKRNSIPVAEIHKVNLRDQGRCQAELPDGSKCQETKWIHFHHILPKAQGGKDKAENLVTLCSAHHRIWHERAEEC